MDQYIKKTEKIISGGRRAKEAISRILELLLELSLRGRHSEQRTP